MRPEPPMRGLRFHQHPVFPPMLLGLLLLAAWQLATTVGGVSPVFLPAPADVLSRLFMEIGAGTMLRATAITLGEAALGCLIAAFVALPMGYLIARVRSVEAALNPYLAASQAIPAVALAPLLVLWVGYGIRPVVTLCTLLVFFPIVLATVLGLRTLDASVLEAARIDGAHGWSMIRHIELPLMVKALMTGIRNGFTLSITGAVVGEMVMGGRGLGVLFAVYANSSDTVGIFATIVVLCALAIAIFGGMLALERVVDPCTENASGSPVRSYQF